MDLGTFVQDNAGYGGIGIDHHFSGGLYAKQMHIPAGYLVVGHRHKYDHLSVLAEGSVSVTVEGSTAEYHAPACINIEAHKHHEIVALTPVVWYCIHATSETDKDLIDDVLIEEAVCR